MSLTKLNLEKIKKNIEEALDKESVESLTKWLLERREKKAKIFLQPDVIKSVCESFVVRHNYKQDATCERCGKFPWEHSQTVL